MPLQEAPKSLKHELSVMMLSWEFPPRVIGGISPHVYFLSKSLAKQGVKVYVATCDFPGAPSHEVIDGVEVYRIDSYKTPAPDFATWVYLMNLNMQKETAALTRKLRRQNRRFPRARLASRKRWHRLKTHFPQTPPRNHALHRNGPPRRNPHNHRKNDS